MKRIDLTKLLAVASRYEQLVSVGQQTSTQAGDINQALIDAGTIGLTGSGNNVVWDVNSPTGNAIFGMMDKMNYKGSAVVSFTVDAKRKVVVSVATNPLNANLASGIARLLTPKIQAVVVKLPPPADVVTVSNIITATAA